MKRFRSWLLLTLAVVAAGAFYSPPADARITSQRIFFRTTSAASVAAGDWIDPQGSAGFADSSVFRQIATATNEDTSMAYPLEMFSTNYPAWQPNIGATVVDDSCGIAWLLLTVTTNQTEYSWSGTSALDSIYVGAQVSVDGTTWSNVAGTPTQDFFAATASPLDGLVCLTAIEQATGANFASVMLDCEAGVTSKATRLIINRNLCAQPGWVRFLVSTGAGTGQFAMIATYQK